MTIEKSMDQVTKTFRVLVHVYEDRSYQEIELPVKVGDHLVYHTDHEYEIIECPYTPLVTMSMSLPQLNELAAITVEKGYDEDFITAIQVVYYESPASSPQFAAENASEITLLEIGSDEVYDMGYYMATRTHKREFAQAKDIMKRYFDYEQYGNDLIANSQVRLVKNGVWHLRY